MRSLRETQLAPRWAPHAAPLMQSLPQSLPSLRGNRGSMVGTLFEFYLQCALSTTGFVPQVQKHDCDFIFPSDRTLDVEVKTTSSTSKDVYGNRSAASAVHKARGSFLLAVQYNPHSLTLMNLRFGWVEPGDWIPQGGTGQQARLGPKGLAKLVEVA